MIHRSVLLAICSLSLASCRIIEFSASPPRSGQCSYEIGETVTLTCRVEDVSELSVIFRHGTNKAENGISHFAAYVTSKVPVNKHILHLLKITKLQWDDHGLWECMQGGTAWNATIDITVQSSIEPLRASLAPLVAASPDQHRSGAVAIGNEDGEVTPHILYGKGIKTNPFDLTGGARITLECVTGCSFPATRHRWVFSNHSAAPEVIIDASSTTVIGNCSVPNEVSGMVTRSSVLLSCASFPRLVGSNEVSCSMVEDSSCRRPDNRDRDSSHPETGKQGGPARLRRRSVFVLCPGGHKPWTLTNGEIVGLSIAVGLTALMLVMFFMSAKKIVSSYRYGSVTKGIRV